MGFRSCLQPGKLTDTPPVGCSVGWASAPQTPYSLSAVARERSPEGPRARAVSLFFNPVGPLDADRDTPEGSGRPRDPGAGDGGGRGGSRGPGEGRILLATSPWFQKHSVHPAWLRRGQVSPWREAQEGPCCPWGREQECPAEWRTGLEPGAWSCLSVTLPYAPEARLLGPLWSAGSHHRSAHVTLSAGLRHGLEVSDLPATHGPPRALCLLVPAGQMGWLSQPDGG